MIMDYYYGICLFRLLRVMRYGISSYVWGKKAAFDKWIWV